MGTIAKDKNQITLFYSSENSLGKQLSAYVKSSEKKVLTIDISKTKVTSTQWTEIAEGAGVEISDLIGTDHPDFKRKYGEDKMDLDSNDWLKILEKNPQLLKYPVAITGDNYLILETAASFKEHMENDSEGIENHEAD